MTNPATPAELCECGDALPPGATVCPNCGRDAPSTAFAIAAIATGHAVDAPARSLELVPGTDIVLALGETVWRSYQVTKLRSVSQGRGMLYLTNIRLIFHARSTARRRKSTLVMETKVSRITGVRTYVTQRISWSALFLAVVIFLLGIGGVSSGGVSYVGVTVVGVVLILIGVILAIAVIAGLGGHGAVTVQVYSEQESPSPVSFGNAWAADGGGFFRGIIRSFSSPIGMFTSLFGAHDAFDFLLGNPGPDALQVASELGAIVADLQTKGSLAATHWQPSS